MEQILCRDLALGYDSKVVARGVDFSLSQGDYLCVIGDNGSGKTTLVRTLLGLQPPVSGEVKLPKEGIGYLPQRTNVQSDFPASVREVVMSGFVGRRKFGIFYSKSEKSRAADILERLGISELASKSYRELSGGQQQRVLLARALCATSEVLLLDEPVSALDPDAAKNMYAVLDELNKKYKTTVIMITHDLPTALGYATHILHIGDKCFFGTRKEYEERAGK